MYLLVYISCNFLYIDSLFLPENSITKYFKCTEKTTQCVKHSMNKNILLAKSRYFSMLASSSFFFFPQKKWIAEDTVRPHRKPHWFQCTAPGPEGNIYGKLVYDSHGCFGTFSWYVVSTHTVCSIALHVLKLDVNNTTWHLFFHSLLSFNNLVWPFSYTVVSIQI